MPGTSVRVVAVFLGLLAGRAAADPPQWTPGILDVRVLDEATGKPVRGARVMVYPEVAHPIPGPPWAPAKQGTTDADGRVRIDVSSLPHGEPWVFADAPGFAVDAQYVREGSVDFELARGRNVPIEVVDVFGEPIAGAYVGYVGGCGHTPELRSATTDARGIAVIPSIDPTTWRIWIVHDRVLAEYHDLGRWLPGDPPLVVRCKPGRAVDGRVLDAEGRSVVGAAIGIAEFHHGPWTRTNADGRFHLTGIGKGGGHGFAVALTDPAVTEKMPSDDAWVDALPEGSEHTVRLSVDDQTRSDSADEAWKAYAASHPPRRMHFVVPGPREASIELRSEEEVRELPPELWSGASFDLPPQGACAIALSDGEGVRTFVLPTGGIPDGSPPMVLGWPRKSRVRMWVTAPDGSLVPSRMARVEFTSDRDPEIDGKAVASALLEPEVSEGSRGRWFIRPADRRWRARYVAIPTDLAPGESRDLGDVRVEPVGTRRLTILGPDDKPAENLALVVTRGASTFRASPDRVEDFTGDEDPQGTLARGASVAAWSRASGDLAVFGVLEGDGPWTLRMAGK